jgi:NCAIR mutase (PurE)-related protein
MDLQGLKGLLQKVASGAVPVEEAVDALRHLPYEDIGLAHVDHHRALRNGFPEVIYGQGKTPEQILAITGRLMAQENVVMVTRLDDAKAAAVLAQHPEATYDPQARMLLWYREAPQIRGRGTILVLAAGTSDIGVAREAALTAEAMGNRVQTIVDVGVAGIHRLFAHREQIMSAAVLVVVAGMEGALPSVVAGMVERPVIAVPTSVGYGTSFGGLTALLAMLNSCSSNVAVVNIDNGFGAGYMAAVINRPLPTACRPEDEDEGERPAGRPPIRR